MAANGVKPAKQPPPAVTSVTEHIGNTPLVRLERLPQSLGIEANVFAKLEFFNAGGSVKDRIALRMIEEAERSGRIKPGDTLIEPTSGNTSVFVNTETSKAKLMFTAEELGLPWLQRSRVSGLLNTVP